MERGYTKLPEYSQLSEVKNTIKELQMNYTPDLLTQIIILIQNNLSNNITILGILFIIGYFLSYMLNNINMSRN